MTDFLVTVALDPSNASQGARRIERDLGRVETAASRLKRTLGGALGVLTVGAGLAAGTRLLASFGQEMSSVAAITRSTEAEFSALEERAKSLGTNTRFSASQAAEGMTFLARAGFGADEVLDSIGDTLNLAQSGSLSLGLAADIASNALTAFRLETDQTSRVVDVMSFAANNANTNVEQLGQGLKLVAPIAAGVGVEIEETTAFISKLSDAGLQATLAGTGLRRIISELESPSLKTKRVLKDLGLETSDYRISSVGLTKALSELADAGVDTGLGLEIFGDRGGPAFEVIRKSIGDVESFTAALQNADGTAQRIAETMDDNLNGSILAFKSAAEGLVLSIGEAGATGALRSFFDAITSVARFGSENIKLLSVSAIGLGSAFAAVKIAPLVQLADAFIKLRVSALTGGSVILGSAAALQQQAFASTLAAQATVRRTGAVLAATEAQLAETVASGVGADVNAAALLIEQRLIEARLANAAAAKGLAVAEVELAGATAALTLKARLLALINPFTGFVVALSLAGYGLNVFLDDVNEVLERFLKIEEAGNKFELTEFGKVGDDIVTVQKAIERINDTIEKTGEVSPAAASQLEILGAKLDKLTGKQERLAAGTAKTVAEAEEQIIAIAQLDAAAGNVVASLEKENELLLLNSREREVQTALLNEISELEKTSGLEVEDARRREIESTLRRNQLLTDQATAFESIRGPQEAFAAEVEALRVLQEQGRITTEEQTEALLVLAQTASRVDLTAFDGGDGANLADKLKARKEATDALTASERDRDRALADINGQEAALLLRLETLQQLESEGRITQDQATEAIDKTAESLLRLNPEYERRARLIAEIEGPQANLIQREQDLQEIIESGADSSGRFAAELKRVQEALNPLTEEEQRRKDLIESVQGKEEDRIATLATLEALYNSGTFNLQQYNAELERLGIKTERANTATQGLSDGFAKAKAQFTDVRGAAEDLAVNGFSKAEDAAVEFAQTGKFELHDFTESLLADLTRLLIRSAALEIAGGGGGGFFANLFGGGKAGGGDVDPSKTYVVGEEGPELFSPDTAGSIIPAGRTAAIMNEAAGKQSAPVTVNVSAPPVNIQNFVQGESPEDFDDAVINTIQRNPRVIQGS